MTQASDVITSTAQGIFPATQSRRHPYQTQTEFHVLLMQLKEFERLAHTHDELLELVELSHDAEQQVVFARYILPEHGGELDVPSSQAKRRSELALTAMCMQLAQAIQAMHMQGLVHGDIRPRTVWVTGGPSSEVYALYAPDLLAVDAMMWISQGWHEHLVRRPPEWLLGQAQADERGDLYALGVLIFEQLATLPDVHTLMNELAYYSLQSDVFERLPHLGDVLSTLLEPDHTRRYQTAAALIEDLERCMQVLSGHAYSRAFVSRPISSILRVPDALVGHQELFDRARRAIERDEYKVILVEGDEGIGKTAFLRRLSGAATSMNRWPLIVQCKMTHRALPLQLLDELARQLLCWPHHEVKAIQAAISAEDQRVLTQHCSMLRSLFGEEHVEALGDVVKSEQLHIATHALLHAILEVHDRPLMWCIDDLDQRQTSHFEFLRRLLEDSSMPMRRLTCVISVKHAHTLHSPERDPLNLSARSKPLVLSLKPLTFAQTSMLIQSSLRCQPQPFVQQLTEYIHPITQGVPLLILHMLFMLHTTDVIVSTRQAGEQVWTFDEEAAAQIKLSDALAEIVSKRLDSLSEEASHVLDMVALSKPSALITVLDVVHDGPGELLHHTLSDACSQGLLMQAAVGQYQCSHELIERAIITRLSGEAAIGLHERLLATTHDLLTCEPARLTDSHERHLLTCQRAHHAMQLFSLGVTHAELHHALMEAWRSAIAHSDSSARVTFAGQLIEHHVVKLWDEDPDEALELTTSYSSDLFMLGEAGNAMEILEHGIQLASARAMHKRLALVVTRVELLTLNAFYEQALLVGLAELSLLGITQLTSKDVDELKAGCKEMLAATPLTSLRDKPHSQDEREVQTGALLAAMLPLTYISAPDRFQAMVYRLMTFNLSRPHTPSSSRGYSCYGQLLALDGEVYKALELGQLAMDLADDFGDLRAHAIACSDMANYIAHWTQPLESLHALNMQSHHEAMQVGELQYAGYALMHDCYNRFFAQENLNAVHEAATWSLARCFQLGNQLAIRVIEGLVILLEDFLLKASPHPREDEFIASCVGEGNRMAMALFSIGRSMVCYAQKDHVGAQTHFNRASKHAHFIEGWFPFNELSCISQLTLSEQHLEMTRELHDRIPIPVKPQPHLIPIRTLARYCPENFQHKWLWLQSMDTRGLDRWKRMELIEKAFEAAIAQDRLFDAAVLRVHASAFWQRAGRIWLTQTCRAEAQSLCMKWGAAGLVLPSQKVDGPETSSRRSPLMEYQTQTMLTKTLATLEHLDQPEEFIKHAMHALHQASGSARAAAFVVDTVHEHVSQGALYDHVTRTHALWSHRDVDALSPELPVHLVRMALHGESTLSIPDVRTHPLTQGDVMLRGQGLLSIYILRVPLHRHVHMLIYLDHNQLSDVFTPDREVLIKSQIPLLGLALQSFEYVRLSAQHTSHDERHARHYRQEVIALFEHFLGQIHASTMLIEHAASSISPTIQADLIHISHTSTTGMALLQLLGALELHESERVHRTCGLAELIGALNVAHAYDIEVPSRRCEFKVSSSLFTSVIHTMLLIMSGSSRRATLHVEVLEDDILLTCAPVDEQMRWHVLSRMDGGRALEDESSQEAIVAEIFVRGLLAIGISAHEQDQSMNTLVLRWPHVR